MSEENSTNSSDEQQKKPNPPKSMGRPRKRRPKRSKKGKPRKTKRRNRKSPPPGREVTKIARKMIFRLSMGDALNVALIAKGAAPKSSGLEGKLAMERTAQALTLRAALAWWEWSQYRKQSDSPTSTAQGKNGDSIVDMVDSKIVMAKAEHIAKWPESAAAVEAVADAFRSLAERLPPRPQPPLLPPPLSPEDEDRQRKEKLLREFERLASSLDRAARADIAVPLRELRKKFADGNL